MEKKEVKKWQDEEALKRYQMIALLLEPDMDEGKRQQLREEAAEKNGVSKRTLYRYEKSYREEGFGGLRPASRTKQRQQRLPENFGEIMEQAVQLKREVPKRSVRQIIKVLELEGFAEPGVLRPSTMQRHLYDAGLGKKQMKRYAEKRAASSRRFCRAHRMELLQGDIKYGPELRTTDGGLIKTYLSSLIDDHSRYIVQSEFYDNQRQEIVEDTFHKAVLKAGKFDCACLDNGVQYTSGHLGKACAKLGIRIVHAKPGACQSKGKIEKFHQKVDQFIAEIRVAHVHSVEELNRRWKIFLEQEYQKEAHAGIREYYESYGTSVPASGITPEQEWMRDERGLVFMDVSVVAEAFLHRETRRIDEAGCFSLGGNRYEASAALSNLEAEAAYDPMDMDTVTVYCRGAAPVQAHRMEIGAFASKVPPVPLGMTGNIPVERLYTSPRIEDALGRLVYVVDHQMFAVVTANPGCGKSTMVRMLDGRLGKEKYLLLYLSDSKLTPRWLYAGLLGQLGLEPHYFSGDSKRLLQKEIRAVSTEQKKKVVCVLDEAHLLGKDMLEELRFLLNYKFDSTSPMSLVLVGQTELWEQKLKLQAYEAIRQRIDMNIVLGRLDRAETGKYIAAHMAYAGAGKEIFTSGAEDEVYKISAGIPRMINRVCEKALMYACQQQKRLLNEHMVRFVADHEMIGGVG